jgi:hypothetical protein
MMQDKQQMKTKFWYNSNNSTNSVIFEYVVPVSLSHTEQLLLVGSVTEWMIERIVCINIMWKVCCVSCCKCSLLLFALILNASNLLVDLLVDSFAHLFAGILTE